MFLAERIFESVLSPGRLGNALVDINGLFAQKSLANKIYSAQQRDFLANLFKVL